MKKRKEEEQREKAEERTRKQEQRAKQKVEKEAQRAKKAKGKQPASVGAKRCPNIRSATPSTFPKRGPNSRPFHNGKFLE